MNMVFKGRHTLGDMLQRHVTGICCSDSFPRVTPSFFSKKLRYGDRILPPQQFVARNSAGLSSYAMLPGQNDPKVA